MLDEISFRSVRRFRIVWLRFLAVVRSRESSLVWFVGQSSEPCRRLYNRGLKVRPLTHIFMEACEKPIKFQRDFELNIRPNTCRDLCKVREGLCLTQVWPSFENRSMLRNRATDD